MDSRGKEQHKAIDNIYQLHDKQEDDSEPNKFTIETSNNVSINDMRSSS